MDQSKKANSFYPCLIIRHHGSCQLHQGKEIEPEILNLHIFIITLRFNVLNSTLISIIEISDINIYQIPDGWKEWKAKMWTLEGNLCWLRHALMWWNFQLSSYSPACFLNPTYRISISNFYTVPFFSLIKYSQCSLGSM